VASLRCVMGVRGVEERLGPLESHCVRMLLRFSLLWILSSRPLNLSLRLLRAA
jgi:hypothetical protein